MRLPSESNETDHPPKPSPACRVEELQDLFAMYSSDSRKCNAIPAIPPGRDPRIGAWGASILEGAFVFDGVDYLLSQNLTVEKFNTDGRAYRISDRETRIQSSNGSSGKRGSSSRESNRSRRPWEKASPMRCVMGG